MFTGIVETIGSIQHIQHGQKSSTITIYAPDFLEDTMQGDSICTNGVCLTVVHRNSDSFTANVMAETLRNTNLIQLQTNSTVNLEKALTLSKKLGGHLVSGHIDGIGIISSFLQEDNAVWITIKPSPMLLKYIILRGSITLDGVSLTIANIDSSQFKVSIIPHTKNHTTLLSKKIGDSINIECDMIAKYTEKLLGIQTQPSSCINENFLKEHGFL